jgi:hypothetical protein
MRWAALITWVLAAGGGFVLLSIWLARGGVREQRDAGNRIRTPQIMSHFLLAAAGLVLWIVYLVDGATALAWIAFAALLVVALLGFAMVAVWLRRRSGGGATAPGAPAEQHFPLPVVGLHGALAAATLVLVLLTALGVG